MIFNKLCKIIENIEFDNETSSILRAKISDTKLFNMIEVDKGGKVYRPSDDHMPVNLLPYNNMAIEKKLVSIGSDGIDRMTNTCILIFNLPKEQGLVSSSNSINDIYFTMLLSTFPSKDNTYTDRSLQISALVRNESNGITLAKTGNIKTFHINSDFNTVISKRTSQIDDKSDDSNWFNIIINSVLDDISIINDPKKFIIQCTPSNPRISKKKISRSNSRPIYTILNLSDISKRYGLTGISKDAGASKSSHPRRAHKRTLRNERFGDNIGKTIKVKETWIGPSVATLGNKIYRVILNR